MVFVKGSIKQRLLAMGIISGAFYLFLGGLILLGLQQAGKSVDLLYQEHLLRVEKVSRMNAALRDTRLELLLAMRHDPRLGTAHSHPLSLHTTRIADHLQESASLLKEYAAAGEKSSERKKLEEQFGAAQERLVREGVLPAVAAVEAGDFDKAEGIVTKSVNPLAEQALKSADDLEKGEVALARGRYEEAKEKFSGGRVVAWGAIFLAMSLGTAINLLVIGSIRRGSADLVLATTRMAGGDLTAVATNTSDDELGQVGRSFNAMREAMVRLIGGVTSSAERVMVTAEQVHATSEQMATGAEQVASRLSTAATSGEEMASTSAGIAQSCQVAAAGADVATDAAASGVQVVKGTIDIMERIARHVQTAAGTVETLGDRSDQIGAIIEVIEDIADQTNLLALNAAIEAARAGEQGRGFAVVADEVRALAERTTKATREIDGMIRAIQAETKGAVAAMEQGVQEVQQGGAEAAESGQALQRILGEIDAVTSQVNQIAIAAEEQTATTAEISASLQQIAEVVHLTASGAHDSATAARHLSSLADELQHMVQQFKLA
ncbi:methyl-accepting chemotaxis protein [Geomonas sp. RF6]|uniref:methyl-accepting chemotaxis protein n=1 Tax=Geomonas sp. RF6 TaxID=2897342 RepID=UPI001E5C6C81|nr:methyl-accepting chemotaxis protein [Geomonas sp. RF6]UFS69227.1 methyl-accepting chemotaxis protein [Geomonas sp. RF6]